MGKQGALSVVQVDSLEENFGLPNFVHLRPKVLMEALNRPDDYPQLRE